MALTGRLNAPQHWQQILAHWLWALPCLLLVAWLGIEQADLYPPETDEFYSMFNTGYAADSLYTPGEVLDSLQRNSANHTPLYFILLNLWARLVGIEIALARILTVFTGMLSLAVIYRLGRDFVAPLAGIIALLIALSNTYHNFFISHARMFPLMTLLAGVTLWLYLRLVTRRGRNRPRDYVALAATVYFFANSHAFSALPLAALGAYHLLHVRKDRRWLHVSLAVLAGLALFLPWATVLLGPGLERSYLYLGEGRAPLHINFRAWTDIAFNGSMILAAATLAGGWLFARKQPGLQRAPLSIAFYFMLALLAVMATFDGFYPTKIRYALAGLPLMSLCAAAAVFALAKWRWWLGGITVVWLLAGLSFQQIPDWVRYFGGGRELAFREPPWQVLSRHAVDEGGGQSIVWYGFGEGHLVWHGHIRYPQAEYYFKDRGIDLFAFVHHDRFESHVRFHALNMPRHWVVYDSDLVDEAAEANIDRAMSDLNYRGCERLEFGRDGRLIKYSWAALDCGDPAPVAYDNEALRYEFHSAALSADKSRLLVMDRWLSIDGDPSPQTHFSHQLLDADWQRVASLDLPLAMRPDLRQSAIDVSAAPPGEYRLVAIIYDRDSMQRSSWLDGESFDSMLQLATIVIPES